MAENRQAARLLKLLAQLKEQRSNDKYAEDFPQKVGKLGALTEGVPTLPSRFFSLGHHC